MRNTVLPIFGCLALMATGAARATQPGAAKPADSPAPLPDVYIQVRSYTGEQDSGAPQGAKFVHYFTPEVGPYKAALTPGITTGTGQLLEVGGLFANFPGAVLSGITQPCGNAVIGTFAIGRGHIKASDNKALLLGMLPTDDVNAVAQTGVPLEGLPAGVTIKNLLQFDGNGNVPFFMAQLQGAGVTASNSLALCSLVSSTTSAAYGINVLLRPGQMLSDEQTVRSFTTLVGSAGTFADGRWRCDFQSEGEGIVGEAKPAEDPVYYNATQADGQNWIGVRLTYTDGSEELVAIPYYAQGDGDWFFLVGTGSAFGIGTSYSQENLDGTKITSFGLPCFDYAQVSSLVKLAAEPVQTAKPKRRALTTGSSPSVSGTVDSTNDTALIYQQIFEDPRLISRAGDPVPFDAGGAELSGVTIGSYTTDPVMDEYGNIAIGVKLANEPHPAFSNAILYAQYGTQPYLIAQVGYPAPGGGFWASFNSMAFASSGSDGEFRQGGLYFTGKLIVSGSDGVTPANDLGLWGMDGSGTLQLMLRTGQHIVVNEKTRTLKSFVALAAAPGSVGASHGYDDYGDVAVVCYFTDGSAALVYVVLDSFQP